MEWTVHGERTIYDSEWMRVCLVDVELPSGARFEHHVLRMPAEASGVVVDDPERGVLLLWRHRFATDTWGWELPAGHVDAGETPIEAGARETLEETGWQPGALMPLISYCPQNGTSDAIFNVFLATTATYVGAPADSDEAERIEWVPWDTVRSELRAGRVHDGMSLTGLLYRLAEI
ncbi:MAG TPA: NUDIX hydrolase [Ilumatobacteraceae bacterium]|nr:NUDIX hydrolase [Ilumatobacteraceae bacterium]